MIRQGFSLAILDRQKDIEFRRIGTWIESFVVQLQMRRRAEFHF